jgi:hypothetical protein
MPCHAMHPIQDLFLESFSYALQIDMHFICTPLWKKFYSFKKWVLQCSCSSEWLTQGFTPILSQVLMNQERSLGMRRRSSRTEV